MVVTPYLDCWHLGQCISAYLNRLFFLHAITVSIFVYVVTLYFRKMVTPVEFQCLLLMSGCMFLCWLWWLLTQTVMCVEISFSPAAADGLQSAKGDKSSIPGANAIFYPALPPLDRDGGSPTSHHPNEQPPGPSGHGQPPHTMGEMDPSSGLLTSSAPTTATPIKISEVSVGTDPLSPPTSHSHGQPHTASLQGR